MAWFITPGGCKRSAGWGAAWMAIREDEDVAAAVEHQPGPLQAGWPSATGATLGRPRAAPSSPPRSAPWCRPIAFNVLVSINVLAVAHRRRPGQLCPASSSAPFALVGLPELLREFNEFRWWVYGAVLVGDDARPPGRAVARRPSRERETAGRRTSRTPIDEGTTPGLPEDAPVLN
jgi:branched-chain amino acid transport system permease protein